MTALLTWQLIAAALVGAVVALAVARTLRAHPSIARDEPTEHAGDTDRVGLESFAEPLLLVGARSRIVAGNIAARALFGFEIVDADLRIALRNPAALEAVRDARGGLVIERDVGAIGSGDGYYMLRVAPTSDGRLLLSFTDISRIRMAERMRVDFVANASHELRTPLATIQGFVETLQGPAADDPPARGRFLEIMAREAARMTRLIDDLLSLSRIELDKYVRPQTPLELAPLIADVARTLAMRLDADERVLLVDADSPPPVIGERDQILQVLHNLVSNAIKYGRSGTPIRLSVEPAGEEAPRMLRIGVTDRGEGIAPEHLPRLTERFYRVDNSRSRQMGGTGLGLAIVKHIVERHRGRLAIESAVGEGTTVSFTLPLA